MRRGRSAAFPVSGPRTCRVFSPRLRVRSVSHPSALTASSCTYPPPRWSGGTPVYDLSEATWVSCVACRCRAECHCNGGLVSRRPRRFAPPTPAHSPRGGTPRPSGSCACAAQWRAWLASGRPGVAVAARVCACCRPCQCGQLSPPNSCTRTAVGGPIVVRARGTRCHPPGGACPRL